MKNVMAACCYEFKGGTYMKKYLKILLSTCLVLALLVGTALAETRSVYISSTGSGTLNVRSGPGKSYSVSGYVHHGDAVTLTGTTSGEWTKVKVNDNGVTGWIKTKYIDGTTASLGSGTKTVSVPGGLNLNLRSGPSTGHSILGKVRSGDTVKVLNTEDAWVRVSVSRTGQSGWIMAKYIGGSGSSSSGGSSSGSTGSTTSATWKNTTSYTAAVTTASSLNLRTGAGTGYGRITTLARGTKLKIIGVDNGWYQVITKNGSVGYVSSAYVSIGATGTTTANVNFRKGAGTSYGCYTTLSSGTTVTVLGCTGSWVQVVYNGNTGYVSRSYLNY